MKKTRKNSQVEHVRVAKRHVGYVLRACFPKSMRPALGAYAEPLVWPGAGRLFNVEVPSGS